MLQWKIEVPVGNLTACDQVQPLVTQCLSSKPELPNWELECWVLLLLLLSPHLSNT